ncbi:bifunctional adenosylcobinamide kinase/adenosylcobinamide-phosphate guanylyltransferase [Paenisporosarcina sp. TG20]|uniref:bifunctional adenosylcobinamide kinase/adenosylcobinamide-phosphate guanylyltransferase n=1 Tax=Paenisporosarcina sp. TG20 TaxID=1211706 RepID=UPI0002F55F09|nr:bifunctional adenosylcobinamide kinase/adenosylcobinamide-phosphate guanylyltransferase [Paenisporosarcina sp. TG20]
MVRGTLTFISGGVRSGKTAFAENWLMNQQCSRLIYMATGEATDAEMQLRIKRHRQDRIDYTEKWLTIEQPRQIEEILPHILPGDGVLFDCVTTWLANEMYEGWNRGEPCFTRPNCLEEKEQQLHKTIRTLLNKGTTIVVISNEVLDEPLSSIPDVRLYQQWLGRLHQWFVKESNEAFELTYGLVKKWK